VSTITVEVVYLVEVSCVLATVPLRHTVTNNSLVEANKCIVKDDLLEGLIVK
jgi:hypothetical protein